MIDLNIVNLGTYPPKQCGIATFSMDLYKSLLLQNNNVEIMAVFDSDFKYRYGSEVVFKIRQHKRRDYIKAAHLINHSPDIDIVIIQHEYGIYGGQDGEFILDFIDMLNKPYIIVTHTVLPQPIRNQKSVLNKLCSNASAIVCMTERSSRLLNELYGVLPEYIHVINHGVPDFKKQSQKDLKSKYKLTGKTIISTFGLIGPGKGLELGIKAMANIIKDFPHTHYFILGQTHPMLQKYEGEKYRNMLENLVRVLHIEDNVHFINRFLTDEELGEYLYLTDIYLSPYPNKDQAVSGTLAFALGCGRAIVSTAYAYAVEVLANGRGLIAEEADPHELAKLIRRVLSEPELKSSLMEKAYELGKDWNWPSIGKTYTELLYNILTLQEEKQFNVGL